MPFQRRISLIVLTMSTSACFQADDGSDEIAATETSSATDSTDAETTESTTESESDGTSESDTTTGSDAFVFASDPPESYARVDRMGMPAVATALLTNKDAYNASNPAAEAGGPFVNEMTMNLINMHMALDDGLTGLGLTPCLSFECMLDQVMPLAVPDTLKLDLTNPPGFPNGRRLSDPVIDVTLAVILLDLSVMGQTATTFADIPVNPPANDVTFSPVFPFLAAPH